MKKQQMVDKLDYAEVFKDLMHPHNLQYIAISTLLIILVAKITIMVLRKLQQSAEKQGGSLWRRIIIHSLFAPARFLVISESILSILDMVISLEYVSIKLAILRKLIAIIGGTWFCISLVNRIESRRYLESMQDAINPNTMYFVVKILHVLIYAVAITSALEVIGFHSSSFLAFSGIGGAALAFAAQDLLANFFGAIIIHLDKPFKVNDVIESSSGRIAGKVDSIGWRMTRIIGKDKKHVYVPNNLFSKLSIKNCSEMKHLLLRLDLIINNPINLQQVIDVEQDISKIFHDSPNIDDHEGWVVTISSSTPQEVKLFIKAYVRAVNEHEFYQIRQTILLTMQLVMVEHKLEWSINTVD